MLKHGNSSGNLQSAPRCGAKARTRGGVPCLASAIKGKNRCRMHGGKSTGPDEGRARSRRANWKTDYYSQEAIEASRLPLLASIAASALLIATVAADSVAHH